MTLIISFNCTLSTTQVEVLLNVTKKSHYSIATQIKKKQPVCTAFLKSSVQTNSRHHISSVYLHSTLVHCRWGLHYHWPALQTGNIWYPQE